LFGSQAAEDENPEQLKSYFIKNKAYERANAEIALRIIVGHKGVGKSALLKMLYLEQSANNNLAIWLQPNDISRAWSVTGSFVEKVEGIKKNLIQIIAEKSFDKFTIFGQETCSIPGLNTVRSLFGYLTKEIKVKDSASLEARLVGEFLKEQVIFIYVDDIDRGWAATPTDVENISALINATRDMANQKEGGDLRFKIGIRTDAYNLVREHDESGDKFEPYKVPISWTNHDVLVLMAKRIANYFCETFDAEEYLEKGMADQKKVSRYFFPIIVERFEGSGHWSNCPIHRVLLSLTRKRPRDLIKLLSGAALVAEKNGHNIIVTSDLTDSFPDYSKGRIFDIVSEFRSELPEIEKVLFSLRPTIKQKRKGEKPYLYLDDELKSRLNKFCMGSNIVFKNGRRATGSNLAEFLFKIDFVIARRQVSGEIERYFYDDHPKLQSPNAKFGMQWEVHPAYRWARDPQDVREIISSLDI